MCNEIYVEILEDKQSDQISLLRQHITTTVTTQILILTGTEGREGPVWFCLFFNCCCCRRPPDHHQDWLHLRGGGAVHTVRGGGDHSDRPGKLRQVQHRHLQRGGENTLECQLHVTQDKAHPSEQVKFVTVQYNTVQNCREKNRYGLTHLRWKKYFPRLSSLLKMHKCWLDFD